MPITSSHLKLMASARMTDAEDAGGQMSSVALQDGAENNVFNDLASTDFAFGRLSLKKVWPAVLNVGTDILLGAHVIIDDTPDNANVRGWAMLGTSASETRAQAVARLEQSHWEPATAGLTWANAPHFGTRIKSVGGVVPLPVGSVVFRLESGPMWVEPVLITSVTEVLSSDSTFSEGFSSMSAGDKVYAVTYDGTFNPLNPGVEYGARLGAPSTSTPRIVTTRPISGALSIGDTYCEVDTLLAVIVPKNLGATAGSEAQIGIGAGAVLPAGRAVAFRAGDGLVIHHTTEIAAATYANGNTIDCGRTNLSGVRLVGADGASISTGWTVNLATGIVTVSSISGWSQPVKVRHTIEEVLACSRTGYPEYSGGSAGSSASTATAPFTLSAGLTMYCGRPNVGSLRVISRTGQDITDLTVISAFGSLRAFAINLSAGTATLWVPNGGSSVEVNASSSFIASHSPVTLVSSGSYTATGVSSAPQAILNRITFNRALTRAFPSGSLISSMLFMGDLQARVGIVFSQQAWGAVWADSRIGDAISPQYQVGTNPIVVNNAGAVTERWAFVFLTSTTFRLIGETLGVVAEGNVNSNFAPNNPATGQPYMTVAAAGWGTWASGNVLRVNTFGANAPVWVARAVLPSAPSTGADSLTVAVRGDIDA